MGHILTARRQGFLNNNYYDDNNNRKKPGRPVAHRTVRMPTRGEMPNLKRGLGFVFQ